MTDTYIAPTKRHLPKVLQTLSIIFGSVLALYALYQLLGFVGEIERLANMFIRPEYLLPIDVTLEIINFVSTIAFVFSVSVLSVSLLTSKKTPAKIGFIGCIIDYALMCIYWLIYIIYQIDYISSLSYAYKNYSYYTEMLIENFLLLAVNVLPLIASVIAIRKISLSETHNSKQKQWKAPVILFAITVIVKIIMFINREIEIATSNTTVIYNYNRLQYIFNVAFGYIAVGIVCFAIVFHTLPYGKIKTPKPVFAEEIAPAGPAMPAYTPEAEYAPTVANVPEPVYTAPVEEFPAPMEPAPQYIPAPAPVDLVTPKTNAKFVSGELVEYKKLLDMGIITQEEFDAKKKQLLGL